MNVIAYKIVWAYPTVMTMTERKECLNIYIAKIIHCLFKKDGKEIQINLQKLKSIFEISSWLQLRGYPDMCIKIPSLSIMQLAVSV